MSGDYSRRRFDPNNDYSAVLMQQGRVQLDADWNEWAEALDRRQRAETIDTLGVQAKPGIRGVAVVSPQTPDAFKIHILTDGKLAIGVGRMYVDGLLAENHGEGKLEFDPVLAEQRGTKALDYSKNQPYFPSPPELPGKGTHLVYLEVWQREVTHVEDPDLVEKAVGVDTTARLQTVWQVRLLAVDTDTLCTTPDPLIKNWSKLITPSAGRLSTTAESTAKDTDPCEMPLGGGYRGLENQLYRVEIHNGGPVGTADFKWSRDNASVASGVEEVVSCKELKLYSLGRDAVLGFNDGDWVEILDDHYELCGEGNDPAKRRGLMCKITVNRDTRTIILDTPLTNDLCHFGENKDSLARRHLRVKRWDMGGSGLITVRATDTWVELENGVQIKFDLDGVGTEFHSGDWWVFAARSADASVEPLDRAPVPPRGVHRHYARLAVVNFNTKENHDCRTSWPPGCGGCCTVTVGDGIHSFGQFTDLQAAINAAPDQGTVCILRGHYTLKQGLKIKGKSLSIIGCGKETVVTLKASSSAAFMVKGNSQSYFRLENLKLELTEIGSFPSVPMVEVHDMLNVDVARCIFENLAKKAPTLKLVNCGASLSTVSSDIKMAPNGLLSLVGRVKIADNVFTFGSLDIVLQRCEQVEITGNAFYLGRGIELGEGCLDVLLENNRLEGASISLGGAATDPRPQRKLVNGLEKLRIIGNQIRQAGSGISTLDDYAGEISGLEIKGNHIFDGSGSGITLRRVNGLRIEGNQIFDNGSENHPACGIFLHSCSTVEVIGNQITNNGSTNNTLLRHIGYAEFQAADSSRAANSLSFLDMTMLAADGVIDLAPELPALRWPNRVTLEINLNNLNKPADTVWLVFYGANNVGNIHVDAFKHGETKPKKSLTKSVQTMMIFELDGVGAYDQIKVTPEFTDGTHAYLGELYFGNPAYQAGLVAFYISPETPITVAHTEGKIPPIVSGSTLRVAANVVDCPSGPALLAIGTGAMSISDNRLVSRDTRTSPPSSGVQDDSATLWDYWICKIAGLGKCVSILNFGLNPNLAYFYGAYITQIDPLLKTSLLPRAIADGPVLFHGNQVYREVIIRDEIWSEMPLNVVLFSGDDVSLQDNQCVVKPPSRQNDDKISARVAERPAWYMLDVLAVGATVRLSDNAFTEPLGKFNASALGLGMMTTAMGNHATHCIYAFGFLHQNLGNLESLCALPQSQLQRGTLRPMVADPSPALLAQLSKGRTAGLNYYAKASALRAAELETFKQILFQTNPGDPRIPLVNRQIANNTQLQTELLAMATRESRIVQAADKDWIVHGQVSFSDGRPAEGVTVRLFDRDFLFDDVLGKQKTDEFGDFRIVYHEQDFSDIIERQPDLYLQIEDDKGRILFSSQASIRYNAGKVEYFPIVLPKEPS